MFHSIVSFASAWFNLPFTVLFGMGLLLAGMQLVGLGGSDDGDHDLAHDADLDHDVDVDHDVDLDHDADLDHGVDHDADQDVDHDAGEVGNATALLAFLGVGKTPLLVVLLILFESVALLGWLLNGLAWSAAGAYPTVAIVAVLPAALVGGCLVTSRTARLIGSALPPLSTTASRAQALVGLRGKVISPYVDEQYGMVHLRDAGGTLISVFAVIRAEEPIKRGAEVVLVSYDPEGRRYIVTATGA